MRPSLDPRRSLVAAITWLVIALAASFAFAASWWAGRVARDIVVAQHVRRLVLETDQLGSDLGQAVSARLAAARAVRALTPALPQLYEELRRIDPQPAWIAVADLHGRVAAGDGTLPVGADVSQSAWFVQAVKRPWIGIIGAVEAPRQVQGLGDLALPLYDADGRLAGVAAAHLSWHWINGDLRRLSTRVNSQGSAQTLVLDDRGIIRVGPEDWLEHPWSGRRVAAAPPTETTPERAVGAAGEPRFEQLPDGGTVLVARAQLLVEPPGSNANFMVQLSEPRDRVYQRANALAERILWISVSLGALTASAGALGARRLTERLRRLTGSAAAVGRNEIERIEIPAGQDEVTQLTTVLAKLLADLRQERHELLVLSGELERRVAVRPREVERLAEESRYAAIVRERLKIARDLHDTLAHSMMAMLSEVRLLRKLQAHDPASLPEELARAEQVAHQGLNEARTAITQMRVNLVRDTGLGPALAKAFDRFIEHTGLCGEFVADPEAARFGDERAETLFRMAEEALRNIERHAMASRVSLALSMRDATHLVLRIQDDGIGFDASAAHPGHYGLVGMREQAQLIDADLRILSPPHQGTTLLVAVRVAPETLWPMEVAAQSA